MLANQIVTDHALQTAPKGAFDESNVIFRKIKVSLERSPDSLTESDIWEMLAEDHSHEWIAARDDLRLHEADLQARLHPDHIPLGLIGAALDAGELDQSRMRHCMALAGFTVINETLRQKPELKMMMKSLVKLRETLQDSHHLSMEALKLTSHFSSAKQKASKDHAPFFLVTKADGFFAKLRNAFTA